MTINAALLRQTLEQIETHPETWEQGSYRCGTGMCFAGWAAELAGGHWLAGPDDAGNSYLIAEPDDGEGAFIIRRSGEAVVDAHVRAQRILGLTWSQAEDLFDGSNTLLVLRQHVAELLDTTHHVTIESIPEDQRDQYDPLSRPRLVVVEHRPGQSPYRHGTDGWIPLEALESYAREIATRVGVPYVAPMDPAAYMLLNPADPAELDEEAS